MPAGSVQSETTHRGRLLAVEVRSSTDGDGRAVVRDDGRIRDAKTIAGLLRWQRDRESGEAER